MKKNILIIIVIIFVLIIVFYFMNKQGDDRVCFGDVCFNVEIVDTPTEREIGLMNRESLDENAGMLFIFEYEGYYPFWMKNTLIPLDMIWINSNRTVVDIKNAIPCKEENCPVTYPYGDALYVLEINGGTAVKKNITLGQEVKFFRIN